MQIFLPASSEYRRRQSNKQNTFNRGVWLAKNDFGSVLQKSVVFVSVLQN